MKLLVTRIENDLDINGSFRPITETLHNDRLLEGPAPDSVGGGWLMGNKEEKEV